MLYFYLEAHFLLDVLARVPFTFLTVPARSEFALAGSALVGSSLASSARDACSERHASATFAHRHLRDTCTAQYPTASVHSSSQDLSCFCSTDTGRPTLHLQSHPISHLAAPCASFIQLLLLVVKALEWDAC